MRATNGCSHTIRAGVLLLLALLALAGAPVGSAFAASQEAPPPTLANVRYGPHERNVMDFWQAERAAPTPLVVFFHGGGFVGGDKRAVNGAVVRTCLAAGVSVLSANYRFLTHAPIQQILRDTARVVQFARHQAGEWNLDPERIACFGASAGAGASLWLAVHEDLADPQNADPVLRQSSRIRAAACLDGQASYDLTEWEQFLGTVPREWFYRPAEVPLFYHLQGEESLRSPEGRRILADCSMLRQISAGDAAVFMFCSQPAGPPTSRNHLLHHPGHMDAVRKRCEAVGVPCTTVSREEQAVAQQKFLEFMARHLGLVGEEK